MKTQYLLAKYVPDLTRMEPVNIGVVTWYRGHIRLKFREADSLTCLDNKELYDRWIRFWNKTAQQDEIIPYRSEPVKRKNTDFLKAFCETQDGQFLLVDGGFVMEKTTVKELDSITNYLFEELVADPSIMENEKKHGLTEKCKEIFNSPEISDRVQRKFRVKCGAHGTEQKIPFDWGHGNGKPESLFEKVNLNNSASVFDAAFKFQCVIEPAIVPKERCVALVDSSGSETEQSQSYNRLIESYCPIIDVSNKNDAREQVLHILDSCL